MTTILIFLLSSFIVGIITFSYTKAIALPIVAICTLISVLIIINKKKRIFFLLLAGFFIFGIIQTFLQEHIFWQRINKYTNKKRTFTAKITDKIVLQDKQQTQLTVSIYSCSMPYEKSLILPLFQAYCLVPKKTVVNVGDSVELVNTVIAKPYAKKSNDSSFYTYLLKENILGYIYLNTTKQPLKRHSPSLSLRRWIWEKRENLFASIKKKLSLLTGKFFALIFLGNKTESCTHTMYSFQTWGLSHFLARSGLHIALLIIIWSILLSFVPIHITLKRILILTCATCYHFLSWSSLSFLRAYLFFIGMQQGFILNQQSKTSHIFIFICLLILAYNPYQLFFLDFQLSFGLTFALIFFSPPIKNQSFR